MAQHPFPNLLYIACCGVDLFGISFGDGHPR